MVKLQTMFDAAAEYNGWTSQKKSIALILALRGKAPTISPEKQKEYITVIYLPWKFDMVAIIGNKYTRAI